jgi:non-heme chloroperoxidase
VVQSIKFAAAERIDHLVRSGDGIVISAHEWGDRNRPTIVLVHGYLQSYLSWRRQIEALCAEFHVVAFDLRGHGASDKPIDGAAYRENWRWASDIEAVLRATHSRDVTLVGWSMGGRAIMDYLEAYGQAGLRGIIFVDSGLSSAPGIATDTAAIVVGDVVRARDLESHIAATIAFLRACFTVPPSPDEFAGMLAYNMLVPPVVRSYMGGRSMNFDVLLGGISVPTLIIQGEQDALISSAAATHLARMIPDAVLHAYPGVGHSPFYESSTRFNEDVAAWVRTASNRRNR